MVKVALFGLSANPPTGIGGHQGVVRHVVQMDQFDEVWILPVYKHIYDSKSSLLDFEDRVELCKLAFERESSKKCVVRVRTIEREAAMCYLHRQGQGYRVGTIDILDYLNSLHPDGFKWFWIMGMDTFIDLASNKWKESQRLLSSMSFVVFKRPGFLLTEDQQVVVNEVLRRPQSAVQFIEPSSLTDISSTQLRTRLSCLSSDTQHADWTRDEKVVSPLVLNYLLERNLYKRYY
eukprot:gene8378-9234_t